MTSHNATEKIRHRKSTPCPVCNRFDEARRGSGERCFGFTSGEYVHCTREDWAGNLTLNPSSSTYPHVLNGDCRCGGRHEGAAEQSSYGSSHQKHDDRHKIFEEDYVYFDEAGTPLFRQRRYRFTDAKGGKTFKLERYEGGVWKTGLQGVRRVLYHLDELRKLPPGSTVYIPEGEKDCDRLKSEGLHATTNAMGAKQFIEDYVPFFKDLHVVIPEDNDDEGRDRTKRMARMLNGTAKTIKIIDFPEMQEHYDISDWLDDGNTIEALINLVAAKFEWRPAAPNEENVQDSGTVLIPFPEIGWRGLFSDYRDLVGPTTEASDVFHFWMMVLAFGATLGRRIFIDHAGIMYANFYIILVGLSGWARKDTAFNRVRLLLDALHQEDERERSALKIVYNAASWEGFLTDVSSAKAAIFRSAEFASLLKKGKQEATANLIPKLTELYDCPPVVEHNTRTNPVTWPEPFLSIAAGTTKEWLQRNLSETDIKGGFGNRCIFVLGERKPASPYPPKVDKCKLSSLVDEINSVRAWADSLKPENREIVPDSDARQLFKDWYVPFYEQASGDGIISSLAVRMQDFAWKLAMLYAAWERKLIITQDHLEAALKVVDWLRESNRAIFTDFFGTNKEIEGRIVTRLEKSNARKMVDRDMYRSLSINASRLAKIYDGLRKVGIVNSIDIDGRPGHILAG